VAEVKLNWNSTEQSPQNQIGAPDQLHSELNLRPPDCNRTCPKHTWIPSDELSVPPDADLIYGLLEVG
jgi:hypothetical protein